MRLGVQQLSRIMIGVAIVLALICAASIALLMSPAARSRAAREQELERLQAELKIKQKELGPISNIEARLDQAKKQQAAFYADRLPARYSDISETIAKLATENHVQLGNISYDTKTTPVSQLQQVNISAQVSGDYSNQVRFINALERSKLFFVLQSVDLAGGEGGAVRLGLRIETYLRSAA